MTIGIISGLIGNKLGGTSNTMGHGHHNASHGSNGFGKAVGGGLFGGLLHSKGSLIQGLLGGITGGSPGGNPLGQVVSMPLGLFSGLVGHDSAAKAAANGDASGWLVNTFDHSGHSHALGGADHQGSSAPLAILGTIGQEASGLVGLDKVFGSALGYDAKNGTSYASGGNPNYGITGNIGIGQIFGKH